MSLRDAIDSLSGGLEYTVTRTTAGSRTRGRYAPGSSSTFTIGASIQPLTGLELQDTSDGQWGNEVIEIYTRTELRSRKRGKPEASAPVAGNDPDTIEWNDETYEIVSCKKHESFGDVHWIAHGAKVSTP